MSFVDPPYSTFDAPAKFTAIQNIIAKRLKEYPNAICSYSGGSDSDIMIDLIEKTRSLFQLPPVKYVFFNTGLEMRAIKEHVAATAEKYGVEIETIRPKMNIVQAVRKYGIPFYCKNHSEMLERWQRGELPLSIADEYAQAEDKAAKRKELGLRYPNYQVTINFICGCKSTGEPRHTQMDIDAARFMREFIDTYPPDFKISAKCCTACKKRPAHQAEKGYDMIITGERRAEGGTRSIYKNTRGCFSDKSNGQHRLRPLYYVSDSDKEWYKEKYNIRYSDAYEVYGLTRTGCCGCPISYKAAADLELIRPYEPNLVKAAWNIFGKSYEYRAKYNEYKAQRYAEIKRAKAEAKEGGGDIG